MKLEEIRNISVLGAGIMGHGIAQSFLMGGYPVSLYDVKESILDTARAHMKRNLELFRQFDLIGEQDIPLAFQRLSTHTDLRAAVEGSDFIVEAAPEDLSIKQGLFEKVESFCRKDAIIASNTSSLTLRDIGARVKDKERLVITHWFNPPHIVPTVEVVKGEQTSDETMETAYGVLAKIKKVPVKIYQELPGFVVNRIQVAMVREVFDLFEKGALDFVWRASAPCLPPIWEGWSSGSGYARIFCPTFKAPRNPQRHSRVSFRRGITESRQVKASTIMPWTSRKKNWTRQSKSATGSF
jgi:3-hydroxyacyl-CoA dehydrogenase